MNCKSVLVIILLLNSMASAANGQNSNPTRIVTGMFEYPVGNDTNQATDSVEQRGYGIEQWFNNPIGRGYCTDDPYRAGDTPAACVLRINPRTGQHYRWLYRHSGLDINQADTADCNDPVYAPADGIVTAVIADPYPDQRLGSGNMIRLQHRTFDGIFDTMYEHLNSMTVSDEDVVYRRKPDRTRTQIGTIGNTGFSFGCHLHFPVLTEGASDAGYYANAHFDSQQGRMVISDNGATLLSTHRDPAAFIAAHQYPYTAVTDADNPYFCTDPPINSNAPDYVVSCTRQTQTHAVGSETLPKFRVGDNITLNGMYIDVGRYNSAHTQASLDVYVERDGVAFTRRCTQTVTTNCLDHQAGPWGYTNEPHTAHVTPIIRGAQLGTNQTQAVYRFYTCIRFVGQTRPEAQCKQWPDFDVRAVLLPTGNLSQGGTVQLAGASAVADAGISTIDAGNHPVYTPIQAGTRLAAGACHHDSATISAEQKLVVGLMSYIGSLELRPPPLIPTPPTLTNE